MSSSGVNLEKCRIPLEEIIRATKDFSSETHVGDGGFGMVHRAQLSERWGNRLVAIKRLNPDGSQGNNEFHNELEMVSSPRNQPHSEVITRASGTRFYIDPVYNERGRLSKESDIYSFGVVMFEMSSGTMAYDARCFGDAKEHYLIDIVRSYYDDHELDGLDKLIDPLIRGDIDMSSFDVFNEIAHECINMDIKKRPTIDRIIQRIEEALHIQEKVDALIEKVYATKSRKRLQDEDNNHRMAYSLSNACNLLFLIQESSSTIRKPPPPTSILGRMIMAVRSSSHEADVEANARLKVPPTSKADLTSGKSIGIDSQFNCWQLIVDLLNNLLNTMKENFVCELFIADCYRICFAQKFGIQMLEN
ncbi:hypothetical protein L1887_17680 [Cichorium endivia]|nr:hypothetical protein L1887_17680 [Cichorium endivia]